MNGIVDTRGFSNALSRVMRLAARRSPVPVLEQVKVDFTETTCTLTATDLEQWGVMELPTQGEAFSFVLGNARKCLKCWISRLGLFALALLRQKNYPEPSWYVAVENASSL